MLLYDVPIYHSNSKILQNLFEIDMETGMILLRKICVREFPYTVCEFPH